VPELAIIVPTRGRPENIRKVIGAWDFTNAWDHADLLVVADADDPEIGGYRSIWAEDDALPAQLVVVPAWLPMVHKLDAAARDAAGRYWAVGFAGDDHLPQTIGWAKRYLTVLHELGSGMVYGDDGYQGAKLSTEWAITSDVVHALGRMVPAPVEHMYCDNAMMDLFGQAGAMRHLPEIRIEHMHPVAGKAQTDAQYQRVNHRDQFRTDRRAYEGWQRAALAHDVAAVRALRAGLPEERPARPRVSGPTRTSRGRITAMRTPRFFKRVRGATPDDILITLADFATQVSPEHEIVELGVFQGRSALQLAWGARQGLGAHVTGVDPWALEGNVYDPPFTDDGSRRWALHWVQSLGYSRDISLINAFSHDVAATWQGKPVGLLYVDGDHTKEGARRDIVAWAPHLAEGARIAVDDYGHPDWPGVGEAVDELVAEGFLEPVELYHDRLAVTRLATGEPKLARTGTVTAITSEGVSPSPYPAMDSQVAAGPASVPEKAEPDPVVVRHTEAAPVREVETVELPDVDTSQSTDEAPGVRVLVHSGELEDVAEGTPITELNTVQLRTLAKKREIVLGARKDKRAEMLAALEKGA
jgi:hypothetical protein